MQTPLLAAVMIVKNEERRLPAALESLEALKPLLAEVCIYDTGSTDSTIEIARSYGARVVEGYWDADFARARNEAAAMTAAKWVLVVDADERVEANVPALSLALREMLTDGMTGYDVAHAHITLLNPDGTQGSMWDMVRLYRPSRCHYMGAVHEDVHRRAPGQRNRLLLLPATTIKLIHYGYDSEESIARRGDRNTNSADLEVARALDDGGPDKIAAAFVHRGRSLLLKEEVAAAEADFRRVWDMEIDSIYRVWAGEYLVALEGTSQRAEHAALLLREVRGLGLDPRRCDQLLAALRTEQGRHPEALALLRGADGALNAAGMSVPADDIVRERLHAAIRCGEIDEAIACAITLVAVHGKARGNAETLLGLWADRPIELLVQLLVEAGHGHVATIVIELARVSELGREVAARLRIADRRAAASLRS